MNALVEYENSPPSVVVERLVARHGVWSVLVALLPLVLRRRPVTPRLPDVLGDHLRRDMGLPPMPDRRNYREIRRIISGDDRIA